MTAISRPVLSLLAAVALAAALVAGLLLPAGDPPAASAAVEAAGASVAAPPARQAPALQLGVETLLRDRLGWLQGKRVGLVTNPTGTDARLRSTIDRLIAAERRGDFELTALYGPEHGVRGGAPAGEYVESYTDEVTGLPVYSLYGATRKPTPEMLADVDVLVFDIQDIGTRFYTYISTLSYVLEAAGENDKQVIVLDRPNPLGDRVEGPVLERELASFVGIHPIPLRHGMTVGEIARLFNGEFVQTPADLRVAKMRRYRPRAVLQSWPMPWVLPSPNIPTHDSAIVYPGTGLVESITASEGRGTTKPFEWIGAGFVDAAEAHALTTDLNDRDLPGVTFRTMFATPTTSKHTGAFSGGVQLHVTNPRAYESVRTGLHVLDAFFDHFDETDWREEANCRTPDDTCWIDTLSGTKSVRAQLEDGVRPERIVRGWRRDLRAFDRTAAPYRIYR